MIRVLGFMDRFRVRVTVRFRVRIRVWLPEPAHSPAYWCFSLFAGRSCV